MIKYSLSQNPFPDSKDLNNAMLATGTKIYAYYEPFLASAAPYSFFDNDVKIGNNESQPPIEVLNGTGWTPAPGNHRLEIKNKSGTVLETVNFSVQSTQPPIPPTDEIQNPVTVTLKLLDGQPIVRTTYDSVRCKME